MLGDDFGRPFGVAPMGMCNLIAPGADEALSIEAGRRNFPHCVSTAASSTLEQSFEQSEGRAWFQLYAGSNNELTNEFIDRAVAAGYRHLVLTVDTPRHSRRTRDLENGFSVPLKWGPKQLFDFASHPHWSVSMILNGIPEPMNFRTSKVQTEFIREDSRGGHDYAFLERLREKWKQKLIVKGVMSTQDAGRIQAIGCDAIYVSNHGGRQLDSVVPAIDALAQIRAAVGPGFPIIFDSGLRSADDVVRALALGADFVMLGRPVLYALGAGGPKGLSLFLDRLEEDIRSVMAQIGVTRTSQIGPSVVAAQRVENT